MYSFSWLHLPTLISLTTVASEKSSLFYPFPIQKHKRSNWSRSTQVIIWTDLVVLKHQMLQTKFQGHRLFGSGEDFFKVFTIYGMAAIFIMWPGPFEQSFVYPFHRSSIWNVASIIPVVSEEMLENVDNIHTHGQQRPVYTTSSPMSLWLRWANNSWTYYVSSLFGALTSNSCALHDIVARSIMDWTKYLKVEIYSFKTAL